MPGKPVRRSERTAVAYFRTSSASNVGGDKDSLRRQRDAVLRFAQAKSFRIEREFNDPAVSGADPIHDRPGFAELLNYVTGTNTRTILVENASRFARDLAVQIAGHDLLRDLGIALIPVDAPDHFTDETPTAVMVRQILGAVAEFQKSNLVQRLRKARAQKRLRTGRCEGRKPVPELVVKEARRLYRKNPRTGKRRSLRQVASLLAEMGYLSPSAKPYGAQSVKRMVSR